MLSFRQLFLVLHLYKNLENFYFILFYLYIFFIYKLCYFIYYSVFIILYLIIFRGICLLC